MNTTLARATSTILAIFSFIAPAWAEFNLQITEIWPGNIPGNNLTEDWFEITNFGDTAWTAAIDGNLWYDDVSAAKGDAVLMTGIASIAPGESAVYVIGNAAAITAWKNLWDDVISLPQVGGAAGGAGLGQGGDGVAVWVSTAATNAGLPTVPTMFEIFPDENSFGGQSWDTVLGAFSVVGNASGAVSTLGLNSMGQPAIGSPGAVVPEPGSIVLAGAGGLALLGLACRRHRRRAK